MKATWDDNESELDEEAEKEISSMCFITINEEVKSLDLNDKSSDDEFDDELDDLSYEELLNDFNYLHKNYEKLIFKNGALKKKISSLLKELEGFSKEKEVILTCNTCESLKNENTSLNEKVLDLTKIVCKFSNGKKNFEMMLGKQKGIFDKGCIGYKFLKHNTSRTILLKLLSQMTQSMYVIIVIKMGIQAFHVLLRRMLTLVSNKNGCQRFQRLTLKDPKLCGY